MRAISVLAASFLVATVATLSAQMPMPKPAPEMSQMAFFEGMWACEGNMLETPISPAGAMSTTADIKKDLDGFWQVGTIKGTAKGMPPFEGRFYVTYDPTAKTYTMFWADSMGGWSTSTASGWKGDTIVYEGDMHMGGQTIKSRETFTKGGASMMKHVSEAQMSGKWMPTYEETCKKK